MPLDPLWERFARWLANREPTSFEVEVGPVPREWCTDAELHLTTAAVGVITTGDASIIAQLVDGGPPVVFLLGGEGGYALLAPDAATFLHQLAALRTGVPSLTDPEDVEGLAAWLEAERIRPSPPSTFDLDAFIDREAPVVPPLAPLPELAPVDGVGPRLRALADLVGRRADDPRVAATVSEWVPTSTSDGHEHRYVGGAGFDLFVSHGSWHPAYPPIRKTRRSYVPYVARVFLYDGFGEALPHGVHRGITTGELTARLGPPHRHLGTVRRPVWDLPVGGRDVALRVAADELDLVLAD
jgi:hypothetical protein